MPEQVILSGDLYKQTVAFDYVVKRHVKLYSNRFETYADEDVPNDHRTFRLDHAARLQPGSPNGIQLKKRYLRPPGVGSMTALAAVRGKGAMLELWTFKLKRDEHSDFTFCFQDRDTACQWFDALAQVISALRVAPGKGPLPAAQHSPKPSITEARDSLGVLPPSVFQTLPQVSTSDASYKTYPAEGPSLNMEDSVVPLSINTSHHENEEDEFKRLLYVPTGATTLPKQRWVPYRHSNGLAIYQHHSKSRGEPPEYMVSAVIRGSPTEVLRALMDPHSATTILGPALEVEVLDSSPGRQTLRIALQAEGPNAAWFRPREAIVHRMLNKQEDGVYAVLFNSVETDADGSSMPSDLLPGVIEVAEGLDERACRTNPIRCRVTGGYTISKQSGYGADSSPETLLTCILQVQDMGGWLNPRHPLFRVVNWWSAGAYEAFLERMLLGVVMVRDIVEKSRFAVTPQVFSDAGAQPGQHGVVGQAAAPRSSSVVLRHAASSLARVPPGSPSAVPTSHQLTGSPFAQELAKAVHSQVQQVRQQDVKVSRLASLRLGSGVALRSRTLTASLGGALPEVAPSGRFIAQQWDNSFQLPDRFYEEIHTPGHDSPFRVRGPRYLSDGVKVSPGQPMFELLGMEVVNTGSPEPLPHVSRFLPSVRRSDKPFLFVWNMVVPGPPTICCVFVFGAESHPDDLGAPPDDPEDSDWQPFDFLMWRFLHGDDDERSSLFKMIPRIAEGSWVIKQSVGTTPVIMGRKLKTSYHITPKYVEVAVDVGSSSTAQYVTGMVRGGCKNLVLDLGVVLEGQHGWELPEVLLGAVRVKRLDLAAASTLDNSKEVPLLLDASKPADSATSTATTAAPAAP